LIRLSDIESNWRSFSWVIENWQSQFSITQGMKNWNKI